ncbi:WPP domain-interacting protein 2-like [Carya illinoinensis]|uniref:WPP domain-interacting protein 2-like n=1 Tax=Carya illinoinensis TaxID=32201 RepID=UPI001C723822|nr:WPP domain-interacting protein 2-like [Carya illinoinensis]
MPSSSDQLGFEKIRQTTLSSLEVQVSSLTKVKSLEGKLEKTGAILEEKDCRIAEREATISISKSPKEESSRNIGLQEEKYREIETELEGLFKQKIEAEVKYLALMGTIQIMKAALADQFSEEQNALAEGQALVVNKNGDVESKARMLKKQAEDLEKCCEDIIGTGEVLNMQRRACKLTLGV